MADRDEHVKPPVTSYSLRVQGFVLQVDHDPEVDFHDWVWLPVWQSERGWTGHDLDFLGRRPGPGRSGSYTFLRMICNNTDCPARALIRLSKIEALVQAALPVPRHEMRWDREAQEWVRD